MANIDELILDELRRLQDKIDNLSQKVVIFEVRGKNTDKRIDILWGRVEHHTALLNKMSGAGAIVTGVVMAAAWVIQHFWDKMLGKGK